MSAGFGDVGVDDAPVIKNAGEHGQAGLGGQFVHQLAPGEEDGVVLAHHPVQFDHARPQAVAAGIHAGQQAGVTQVLDVAIHGGARQAHALGDGVRIDLQRLRTEQVQDTQQLAQTAHFVPRKGDGTRVSTIGTPARAEKTAGPMGGRHATLSQLSEKAIVAALFITD